MILSKENDGVGPYAVAGANAVLYGIWNSLTLMMQDLGIPKKEDDVMVNKNKQAEKDVAKAIHIASIC